MSVEYKCYCEHIKACILPFSAVEMVLVEEKSMMEARKVDLP